MCSGPLSMQTKGALPSYRLESAPHGVAMSVKFLLRPHISTGSGILQARAALPSYRFPLVCQRIAAAVTVKTRCRSCRSIGERQKGGGRMSPPSPVASMRFPLVLLLALPFFNLLGRCYGNAKVFHPAPGNFVVVDELDFLPVNQAGVNGFADLCTPLVRPA